jgi:DNA-binding transcriptional MerR regulator
VLREGKQVYFTVGQVAKIARVTVRTLHHYDEIGLLRPSGRLDSGYRAYSISDLERLQCILCYRQLGFSLDQIKPALDDPGADPLELLRWQHTLLTKRMSELRRMMTTVETLMEARTMGIKLEPYDFLEVFGATNPIAHDKEAEQRWGDSSAWDEARRRTSSYTKEDWKRMQAEFGALMADIAAAQADGAEPGSEGVMALAEKHRGYLERWFYPCGYEMQRGLGDLYVNDARFAKQLAKFTTTGADLASYLRDAIYANAERNTHDR